MMTVVVILYTDRRGYLFPSPRNLFTYWHIPILEYIIIMARTRTTFDPFNAIAEPKRRELIEVLAGKELTVSELVSEVGWNQPMVSKHLGVLKEVGLVSEQKQGRYRVYKVNANILKSIHQWVGQFDQYWSNSLDHLDDYLDKLQAGENQDE